MLRGVLPFAAENDIVELLPIFVKCSKIILKQINVVRALAKSGGFCYTVSSLLGCGNAREGEKMEQTSKGLSGNQLKLFAMLAMTVDHFTSVIWPDYPRDWWILLLHIIGRMAAPIFWFMVAEGYHYTRDLKKYAGRLLLFAVIGHFAYNFAFGIPFVPLKTGVFNQTSVMWPLFLGVVGLYTVERSELRQWQKTLAVVALTLLAFPGDWSSIAVLAILEIGQNRGDFRRQMTRMMLWVAMWVNIENSVAAAASVWCAAQAEGTTLDAERLREALASFAGVKRRFEFYVNTPKQVYMDDYAHHPRELAATLTSVRKMFPGRRITALFQPHLYTRTRDLYREFAEALSHADDVVLLPIYPAREEPIEGVTSEIIAQGVTVPCRIVERAALADTVAAMDTDVVVSFGAGNIDACCGAIAEKLKAKS